MNPAIFRVFYSSAHNIHTGNAMHRIRPQTIAVEYIQ
jgi:hypothetical protein